MLTVETRKPLTGLFGLCYIRNGLNKYSSASTTNHLRVVFGIKKTPEHQCPRETVLIPPNGYGYFFISCERVKEEAILAFRDTSHHCKDLCYAQKTLGTTIYNLVPHLNRGCYKICPNTSRVNCEMQRH